MSLIARILDALTFGAPQQHGALTHVPLVGSGPDDPGYLLLDEAVADGRARVTELEALPEVSRLLVVNDADRPLLIVDGQELTGVRQNRIVNLSVLVPAGARVVVPVSCVEAGRWRDVSREAAPADRTHYARGRALKAASVSASRQRFGEPVSDQAAIWADIHELLDCEGVVSPTAAAADLYAAAAPRMDAFRAAFASVPGQLGALFLVSGAVTGLDLFDSPRTLAAALPRLVAGHALQASPGEPAVDPGIAANRARRFVERVRDAGSERFPAPGQGEDVRLAAPGIVGGALEVGPRLVHLYAFPAPELATGPAGEEPDAPSSRLRRAAQG